MTERGYLHPFLDGSRFDYGVGEEIRTILELKMSRLSYYIRSVPSWWKRLNDPIAQAEWKQAASSEEYLEERPEGNSIDLKAFPRLNDRQIRWVLDELPAFARRIDYESGCQPSCFERVWESDSAIEGSLRQELCSEIYRCYLSTDELRRLCTRKTKSSLDPTVPLILDFIHPFDYALVSNRTLHFERGGSEPQLVPAVLSAYVTAIPTDFYIPNDPSQFPHRHSYINNLPPFPAFKRLHSCITRALGRFIPLFEHLLTSLHRSNHALLEPRIPSQKPPLRYEKGEDPPDEPGQGVGEGTDDEEDVGLWTVWGVAHHRWVNSRKVILPDLPRPGFVDLGQWDISEENRVSLRGRKIQVITQLNRMELTPSQPSFNGTHWKCHGSLEDHIVANGCIVLEADNVTEGTLDLRMAVTRPMTSHDDPNSACMAYWGMQRGSKLNQHLGSIRMRQGRCIVYPNLYQHHLSLFHLIDPSRPGHRTILQFQLVDPEIPVLSSSDVPPQQATWAMQALMDSLDRRLPVEILQRIIDIAVEEKWLLHEEDRWPLRSFVEMTQGFYREELKRFFEGVF